MKFIYVLDETNKIKLLSEGYNFICEQKLNNQTIFLFENNIPDKICTFSNDECVFFYTNEIYF